MRKVIVTFIIFINSIGISFAQSNCTTCTGTEVSGSFPSAIGYYTKATADYSFAAGYMSEASQKTAIALGWKAKATGLQSISIGESSSSGSQAYSFGQSALALAQQSLAIGRFVKTDATYGIGSIVIGSSIAGKELVNNVGSSLMIGFNSTVPTFFIGASASFTGAGKVGIGTSSPSTNLHILSNTGENALLYVQNKQFSGTMYAGLLLGNQSHGITADPNNGLMFKTQKYYLFNDGNVGIGTSNPLVKLQVNGSLSIGYESAMPSQAKSLIVSGLVGIGTASPLYKLEVQGDALNEWISKFSNRNTYRNGIMIQAGYSPDATVVLSLRNNDDKAVFNALSNGKVIIGNYINTPDDYSLFVEKGIWTQKVKIDLKTSWPDYVFDDDYLLMSMDELKQFITSNKHLPEIPKEEQLKRDGLDLGEMNILLVKKLEELTLYLLNQNERIKYLEEELGLNSK